MPHEFAHRARRAQGRLSLLIGSREAFCRGPRRARLLPPLRDHERQDIARAERLLELLADDRNVSRGDLFPITAGDLDLRMIAMPSLAQTIGDLHLAKNSMISGPISREL